MYVVDIKKTGPIVELDSIFMYSIHLIKRSALIIVNLAQIISSDNYSRKSVLFITRLTKDNIVQ